jgi:hypothetical protein
MDEENERTVIVQGEERKVLRTYGNGGIGFVEGIGTCRLSKKKRVSPKEKLISDLSQLGMSGTDISKTIHGKNHTPGKAVGVRIITKDPKIINYMEIQDTIVKEAKDRIMGAVEQATHNVVQAIDEGDLVPSMAVLKSVGVIQAKKESAGIEEVKKFGDWLMEQRRVVSINEDENTGIHEPRKVITDVGEINEPTDGVRIVDVSPTE